MFPPPEKIVVVTRKTALEELIQRHNSREQARFYVEARGATFAGYEAEHDSYERALETLRLALAKALPASVRLQWIERDFLPQFVFGERDGRGFEGVAALDCYGRRARDAGFWRRRCFAR